MKKITAYPSSKNQEKIGRRRNLYRLGFVLLALVIILSNFLQPPVVTRAQAIPEYQTYLPLVLNGLGASDNDLCEGVQEEWVCRVNAYRQLVNQPDIKADAAMTYATSLHDNYLILNGDKIEAGIITNFHEEIDNYPGYTPEGEKAGLQSNIVWYAADGYTVKEAIDIWMTYSSHRYGLLHPNFNTSGFDLTCENDFCAASLNVTGSLPPSYQYTEANIIYPIANQKGLDPNVHITWGFYRPWCSPIGGDCDDSEVYFINGSITDSSGKNVLFNVNQPDHSDSANEYKNQIALIPNQPLQSGQTYTVVMTVRYKGETYQRTWKFSVK